MSDRIDIGAIEARLNAATPGPWDWYTNTKTRQCYLATQRWGRVFVMQFARWGMRDGQPRFRVWGSEKHGERPACGTMRDVSEIATQVDHNHEADLSAAHPDAAFIAHAPDDVRALLAEVKRLNAIVAGSDATIEQTAAILREHCTHDDRMRALNNLAFHIKARAAERKAHAARAATTEAR